MREFFKGWRRKVGCVALVMALGLLQVWLRSYLISDFAIAEFANRQFGVLSQDGSVFWYVCLASNESHFIYFATPLEDAYYSELGSKVQWLWIVVPSLLGSIALILWPRSREVNPCVSFSMAGDEKAVASCS